MDRPVDQALYDFFEFLTGPESQRDLEECIKLVDSSPKFGILRQQVDTG
jgi:hypothetical protein